MAERRARISPDLRQQYIEAQAAIAGQVVERPLAAEPRVIAAVDVHLSGATGVAAVVAMAYPGFEILDEQVVTQDITFPYIPGFLAFREAPISLEAVRRLRVAPNLLLADGQGLAHPRRAGIACHVGVELQVPTIGVAKSILVGSHGPIGSEQGSAVPLVAGGEVVGMAVRTRTGVSPVYISVGNLITLEEAVDWTLRTVTRYRLPEPSRRAHRIAQDAARSLRAGEGSHGAEDG